MSRLLVVRQLQFLTIPISPVIPELLDERLGKALNQFVVHPQAKSKVAHPRQRNIISRYIDASESVALFEVTQAIPLFVSVRKI